MDLKLAIISCFLFVIFVEKAQGISCYSCYSHADGDWCMTGEGTRNETEPEDCSGIYNRYNVCNKVYTKFYKITKQGKPEGFTELVSRECGKSHWTGCRQTVGPASYTIHCRCDADGCNAGSDVTASLLTLALPVIKFIL